jgi:3-methylcrotonyl-CoA carboxylase alpha subunit
MRALRCGNTVLEPLVRAEGEGVSVSLGPQTFSFTLEEEAPGVFVLREGRRVIPFHVARDGTAVHLFWDGVVYVLTEAREGTGPARGQTTGALEAPMPGRVTAVKVKPSQRVSRGEELLVVEAMKMENALRAPHDGVVRAIHAEVGDMVGPGRSLVEIEAAE